jgi:hypothetical protein
VGFGLQKVQWRAAMAERVAVQSKISLLGMIMIFCKKDENRLKNGSRKLLREWSPWLNTQKQEISTIGFWLLCQKCRSLRSQIRTLIYSLKSLTVFDHELLSFLSISNPNERWILYWNTDTVFGWQAMEEKMLEESAGMDFMSEFKELWDDDTPIPGYI